MSRQEAKRDRILHDVKQHVLAFNPSLDEDRIPLGCGG
jgi:hypothetical protein